MKNQSMFSPEYNINNVKQIFFMMFLINVDRLLIGEVDELDDEIISYYGNETHPGIVPLNLAFISQLNDTSNATNIKNLIDGWMERLPEGADTNWQVGKF